MTSTPEKTPFEFQFMLTLEGVDDSTPEVRVWIDDRPAGDLTSEKELPLVRETKKSWSARFSTCGSMFIYRVGIRSQPGHRWSLSFRGVGADAEEFSFDSDELTMPKEWLIGTCERPPADASPLDARAFQSSGAAS
jgi:hypothetical protein